MKNKLTLTIDQDAIRRGKSLAKQRKKSLSQIIENYLYKSTAKRKSFSETWQGQFQIQEKESKRYDYLSKKYL